MSSRMGVLGSKHMTFYDLVSEFTQNYFSHMLLVKAITSWSDFRRKTHGVHPLMWGLSKYLQPYLKTATGIFSFRAWPKLLPAVESGLKHSLVMLHMHFFLILFVILIFLWDGMKEYALYVTPPQMSCHIKQ